MNNEEFQEIVMRRGRELYRDMPWRVNTDPYYVLVSELMLQQTQVDRVVPKFNAFISAFPTIGALAEASLSDVLTVWSGLGYNRRAKYLHDAAKRIVNDFSGVIPTSFDRLISLPGIGPNTAGAILVYSFNQPVVFIETNIRTVYFYHFFEHGRNVNDKQLQELVEQTLDREQPRAWYQALMDYGTYLKKHGSGQTNKSQHYVKQAPLKGSLREIRGHIIKALTDGAKTDAELRATIVVDERFDRALNDLMRDGLVSYTDQVFHLTK